MITVQPDSDPSDRHRLATHRGGPTVRRILLGIQLRRYREARGITRDEAGKRIRSSESKMSRLELGRVSFKERDVADLLSLYGVDDEDARDAVFALLHEANMPDWWQKYGDLLPRWFEVYIGLEQAASRIRTYELQFVPGLLQTEDYAYAVIQSGNPDASVSEIEQRVKLRMTRAKLLTQQEPPKLWAVVDEVALRRAYGGQQVMRHQIEHLIEVTKLPNVTLQVVPLECGGHAVSAGSFTMLRFTEPEIPDLVYLEQLTSALYLDKREDVERYAKAMETVSIEARSVDGSLEALHAILDEF